MLPEPRAEDPLVVQVLREHRRLLDGAEASLMQDMGTRWLQIEQRLESDISALANEMARLRAEGKTITPTMVYRSERYKILQSQIQSEVMKYNKDYAVAYISASQDRYATLGLNAAQDALTSMYPSPLSAQFNRINVDAVNDMIGFAGDGSPLYKLLKEDYPVTMDGIVDALIDGVARGQNPTQTARDMVEAMGGGLDRALTIARTETLRVYRTASVEQYRQSGVTSGFKRLVARDEACLACLVLDGEVYELEAEFDDHPNGRCTVVPIIEGMPEPEWQTGQEWFAEQSEERQREIMGDTRFELWKSGIPLSDFATKTHSDVWGDTPAIVPVRDLK